VFGTSDQQSVVIIDWEARLNGRATTQADRVVSNERVTVTRDEVPVGGGIELHTHEVPHIIIPISGDHGLSLDRDGNVLFDIDYKAVPPGTANFVPGCGPAPDRAECTSRCVGEGSF
jgi:hypothetical protein